MKKLLAFAAVALTALGMTVIAKRKNKEAENA